MPAEKLLNLPSLRTNVALGTTVAVAVALTAAPASAATRSAASPLTGMQATLSGTQLTVTPGERASRAFLNNVGGRTVAVACVTGAEDLVRIVDEQTLLPNASFDVAVLGGPAPWPAGSDSLTYSLPRDVSDRVDGCVVGREAAAASAFGFDELGRALLDEGLAEQRLLLAHEAAKQIARARADRRFPAPRALARAIAASEPQLDVAFARDARRARRDDVVYVLGRGTNVKRVVLAHREDGGQPTLLEGRRRGDATVGSRSGNDGTDETVGLTPGEDVGRRLRTGR